MPLSNYVLISLTISLLVGTCFFNICIINIKFLIFGLTYTDRSYFLFLRILFWKSVQSLSHVWPFATPWTAAHQASLSITNSQSLLKLMSIESVMLSNHLILCHPLLLLPSIFPSIGSYPMCLLFASGGQSIGASASASVLSMNIPGWFPLELTDLISCSPRDSQESSPTPQFKNISSILMPIL